MVILLQLLYDKLYLFVAWSVTMVTICIACSFMAPDFSATMQCCRLLQTRSPMCMWMRVTQICTLTRKTRVIPYLPRPEGDNRCRATKPQIRHGPHEQIDAGLNPAHVCDALLNLLSQDCNQLSLHQPIIDCFIDHS